MFLLRSITLNSHNLCVFRPSHTIRTGNPIQNQRSAIALIFLRLQRVHLPILATVLESQCTGQKASGRVYSSIVEPLLLGVETYARRDGDKRLLGGSRWEGEAVKGNVGEAIFNSSN